MTGVREDDAGLASARARVADVLEGMARIDLQVIVVARPDAERRAAEATARNAAIAAGRGELFDEAVVAAQDATMRLFSRSGFSGTWALTEMAVSVARADDRVAAAAAFEEAAMAAVVDDLADPDTLAVLRATADELAESTGMSTPGSLSTLATPDRTVVDGRPLTMVAVVFVVACAGIGAIVDIGLGLLILVAGLALIAAVARRLGRSTG